MEKGFERTASRRELVGKKTMQFSQCSRALVTNMVVGTELTWCWCEMNIFLSYDFVLFYPEEVRVV